MKLKYLIVAIAALPALMLTSCLKSRDSLGIGNDPGSISTGIFDRYYSGANKTYALTGQPPTETLGSFLTIRTSAPRKAASTIHVTLEADTLLVKNYNTANATAYKYLPNNAFTIPGFVASPSGGTFSIDIPAGNEGIVEIPLTLNKTVLDLSFAYAIGVKINTVSEGVISANEKSIIISFLIKNKYDGVYEITGQCIDANGLYHGDYGDPAYPRIYELATTGVNTALFFDQSWNYPNYIVLSNATQAGANTGIRPAFTFDMTTDAVSGLINFVNGTAMTIGGGSAFHPANRSMDLDWTVGRWHVTEHWTFLHDR